MKYNPEELISKAEEPKKKSLKLHPLFKGKIETGIKVPVKKPSDFSIWYTPGVAEPCRKISEDKQSVYEMTSKWNYVAVISDGSRVLGLGNIGPEASLPVMEGKSLLFKYLGGVDAFPLCLNTQNTEEIIKAIKWLTPSFGGINLEDISSPKCYYILEKLRTDLNIPVWHDDQQGTALVTLAGVINALKIVEKKLNEVCISLIGAGAANINVAKYLDIAGARPENMVMVDSKGILHADRRDLEERNPFKWQMCLQTNPRNLIGGIAEAIKDTDICIAYSKPGPGTLKKEWIRSMADDAIVIAGSNPVPEIWPWEAEEAGARIVATGRSDFPNQINNSLGFPAVFRGAFDSMANKISDEMCIAASNAISEYARAKGINEQNIIPKMDETEMYIEEAIAVGIKAAEQRLTRKQISKKELQEKVSENIRRARRTLEILMEKGVIKQL